MGNLYPISLHEGQPKSQSGLLFRFCFSRLSAQHWMTGMMLICALWLSAGVTGQATVTSDKEDYAPRSNAVFTGAGFQAFEQVELKVKNLNSPCGTISTDSSYLPWTVTANASGSFVTNWTVCDCPGDSLRLRAKGLSSGLLAYAYFTDGNVTFKTSGLPNGINVTVYYSLNTGGLGNSVTFSTTPPGTSTTFNSGGTNSSPVNLYHSFPVTISDGLNTYNLVSTSSPSPVSTVNASLTITGEYTLAGAGSIGTVAIGSQSSALVYGTSGSTTFQVTSTRLSNGTVNGTYGVSDLPAGVTFGGFSPSATFTSTGSNPFPPATLSLNVASSVGAGTYNFTVSLSDGGTPATATGILVISKAPTTTTVTINGGPFTYTGSAIEPATVSVTGAGGLNLAPAASYVNNVNAGTATASYSYAGDDNYLPSSDSKDFEIGKATASVTPNNVSKFCGQADPSLTGVLTGFIASDGITATYSRQTGESVGTYDITATLSPTAALGNYNITYNVGTFTIGGVSIDASASSTPVPVGSAANLSATVTPNIGGVSVTFTVTNELNAIVYTTTVPTNGSGVATATTGNLTTLGVLKVTAEAGSGCGTSIAYIPVFDPNGNFVTGGGWINSPAGAMPAQPDVVGKANFGFVSKYKKGSTQVDGNTEFQFQAGTINFKSTMHESGSLVISGGKATYRGSGTINGQTGYKFVVVAFDGNWNNGTSPDRFRIKISTENGGTVIYDNGLGADENGNESTTTILGNNGIGGGSIVIHEAKGKKAAELITQVEESSETLEIRVANNPAQGSSAFRVQVVSNDAVTPINLRVISISGLPVEVQRNLQSGATLHMGRGYTPGIYVLEALQGTQRTTVKLLKQ